ncbi:hypothetical protein, partial [Escherichia coli]
MQKTRRHCRLIYAGDAKENDASNPWRYVRAATATEI